MIIEIGDKVKTKLQPMACGLWNKPREPGLKITPPSYHHSWEVIEIGSDLITLRNKKGETMQVDKDGNGLDEYTNHHIYKITKK